MTQVTKQMTQNNTESLNFGMQVVHGKSNYQCHSKVKQSKFQGHKD